MRRRLRPTFTSTDEKIAIRSDSAEGQIHDGSGVTGARKRSLPHSHVSTLDLGSHTGNDQNKQETELDSSPETGPGLDKDAPGQHIKHVSIFKP